MLQQRQIVKALGNQINTKDPLYIKYAITGFHSTAWMIIYVNVTIYRTVPIERCQSSNTHCIIATKLRSRV